MKDRIIKPFLRKVKSNILKRYNQLYGNRDYQKFLIITRSRTGSNFLVDLLNSHPKIRSEGELFRKFGRKTSREMWDTAFSRKNNNIKYFGFKIFYYHPLDSDDKEFWEYIKEDKNIRIIHLVRKNMLRTVVSRQIALKTSVWTNKKNKRSINPEEKSVVLNIEHCLNEFTKTKKSETEFRAEFKRDFMFELSYEDLIESTQEKMDEVFDFFNLEHVDVFSNYYKQNKESVDDLVVNYDDVKSEIEKTEWSYLLELD